MSLPRDLQRAEEETAQAAAVEPAAAAAAASLNLSLSTYKTLRGIGEIFRGESASQRRSA